MNVRHWTLMGLILFAFAAVAQAGTAKKYRGPENESPRAIALPGIEGLAGAERLVSRAGRIEGLSRWEYWWETNRDRFFRSALRRQASSDAGHVSLQLMTSDVPAVALIAPEDVKESVLPLLIGRLRSSDPEERSIAALGLGRAGNAAGFGPLKALLEGGGPSDRRAASLALGMLGEPLAVPVLEAQLRWTGTSHSERAYAALGLGLLGAKSSVPLLESMLRDSLGHRGRGLSELQSALASSLGLIGAPTSAKLLARVVGSAANRPREVRAAAAIALGRLDRDETVPIVKLLLEDKQTEVRRAAVQAAGLMKEQTLVPALTAIFRDEPDPHARGLAGVALAETGGPNVGKTLRSGLDIRNPRAVRGFAALALGLFGDRGNAERLRELLDRPDEPSLRAAAAIGLALLRDTEALAPLRSIVEDGSADHELRGYAVQALALLGDGRSGGTISRLARDFRGPGVRRGAVLVLGLYRRLPAAPTVLAAVFEETDPWVRGAAISSLALSPRRSVMDSLLAVAKGRSFSPDARKDALLALGVLGAAGRPSALEPFLSHSNYRSLIGAGAVAAGLF